MLGYIWNILFGCTVFNIDTNEANKIYLWIIEDFPELINEDIQACLAFAADREHKLQYAQWDCCLIRIYHPNGQSFVAMYPILF